MGRPLLVSILGRVMRLVIRGESQLAVAIRNWRHRRQSRATLADMDDRMLRDIGVTREQVQKEARKPFWRS